MTADGPWRSGRALRWVVCLAALAVLSAAPVSATAALTGAGSTYVAPVMVSQWIPGFAQRDPAVSLTYRALGSGAGISQWTSGSADFAVSDMPLSGADAQAASRRCGAAVAAIPVTLGTVALIYNVPGLRQGVRLSDKAIAGIFLGTVVNWSDPLIAASNGTLPLPNLPIQVVHRSDASGATAKLSAFLSGISAQWQRQQGSGPTVPWPTGTGAVGDAGIVQQVSSALGALGYVDLIYALHDNLRYARVQNARHQYLYPTQGASVAASALAPRMPPDLQQVIANPKAAGAYPITGYSYLFLCGQQRGPKGKALVNFARYIVTDGQAAVGKLDYARLPASVSSKAMAALDRIRLTP